MPGTVRASEALVVPDRADRRDDDRDRTTAPPILVLILDGLERGTIRLDGYDRDAARTALLEALGDVFASGRELEREESACVAPPLSERVREIEGTVRLGQGASAGAVLEIDGDRFAVGLRAIAAAADFDLRDRQRVRIYLERLGG